MFFSRGVSQFWGQRTCLNTQRVYITRKGCWVVAERAEAYRCAIRESSVVGCKKSTYTFRVGSLDQKQRNFLRLIVALERSDHVLQNGGDNGCVCCWQLVFSECKHQQLPVDWMTVDDDDDERKSRPCWCVHSRLRTTTAAAIIRRDATRLGGHEYMHEVVYISRVGNMSSTIILEVFVVKSGIRQGGII